MTAILPMFGCLYLPGAGSSVHHKCNSAKHRIISPKVDPRTGYSSGHSELQNSDVSEGKTEHNHGGTKMGASGGTGREKRNGKVHKPVLLHQNSTEVSSTNQVEVPDTTQSSPVSISSGLNSDPDMADSPAVTGMGQMANVMSSLSQSVFMSEVGGDPVYSMSPTGGANAHIMGPDATSHGLVLAVTSDKFAYPGSAGTESSTAGATDGLSMLSAGVSEELVLSSSLDSSSIKLPETAINFDPDCFLNNPKQGQTYGGSGLKQENGTSCASSSSIPSTNGLQHSPSMSNSSFAFSSDLIKNIKTEDTSFEQQLAHESGYQVGTVVSCSVSNGTGTQNSLTLTTAGSLLPSGGGLSPSTTLEQMDFSAIDSKPNFSNTSVGYEQAMSNAHMTHPTHSPSFFLQEAPQTGQNQQIRQNSSQKSHLLEHNSHDRTYMGLQVVKTDSAGTNGHLHHHHNHQSQHRPNCNGNSTTENQGQNNSIQMMQYSGGFSSLGQEHEDMVGQNQNGNTGSSNQAGSSDARVESLMKPGDHLQACARGNVDGGASEHYMQSSENRTGSDAVALRNGNTNDNTNRNNQQQLQPLLQGAGLVQSLYNHQALSTGGATNTGGTSMEISLDHFDISFGNQFSDLINDFISVDGGVTAVGSGGALYAHQLVGPPGSDGQTASSNQQQQVQEDGTNGASGYSGSELCLQSCCSPQGLGGGNAGAGASGDAGSLSYMHVADVVSAAVAQGTLNMLQATGRLFMVTDYSPEWSYPEVSSFN